MQLKLVSAFTTLRIQCFVTRISFACTQHQQHYRKVREIYVPNMTGRCVMKKTRYIKSLLLVRIDSAMAIQIEYPQVPKMRSVVVL